MNSRKMSSVALAAAAAMIFSMAAVTNATADEAKVKCTGVNSCKGQSACKGASNSCKGQPKNKQETPVPPGGKEHKIGSAGYCQQSRFQLLV